MLRPTTDSYEENLCRSAPAATETFSYIREELFLGDSGAKTMYPDRAMLAWPGLRNEQGDFADG